MARTPRGEKSTSNKQLKITLPKSQSTSKAQPVVADTSESDYTLPSTPSDRPTATESLSGKVTRLRRRRSTATEDSSTVEPITTSQTDTEELVSEKLPQESTPSKSDRPLLKQDRVEEIDDLEEENEIDEVDVIALGEMLGEELVDIDDDEDEEEDDDDWEADTEDNFNYPHADAKDFDIEILPISAASFPRTCYLVIDRSAELIVRPLKDFADLGSIPAEEVKQKTLPVFDNHRIAKRFSHRRERVIKVPDGRMLEKTSRYLNAKGITRILIDGQIYSL